MATPISDILGWFLTGKKPTQAQFDATFRSFWHKDEVIPTAKVENLDQILNAKAERTALNSHLTDPDAHAELFAKVYNPYRFIVVYPTEDSDNLEVGQLIGAELDAVAVSNQYITDGISFDPDTGTLSDWNFTAGTKHIIFYTKL